MKELIRFINYCWSSWEFWQKALIANIVLQASSWLFPSEYQIWISGMGWCLLFGVFFTWWVRDMLFPKWHSYKMHRNELLTTIKESDKKQS